MPVPAKANISRRANCHCSPSLRTGDVRMLYDARRCSGRQLFRNARGKHERRNKLPSSNSTPVFCFSPWAAALGKEQAMVDQCARPSLRRENRQQPVSFARLRSVTHHVWGPGRPPRTSSWRRIWVRVKYLPRDLRAASQRPRSLCQATSIHSYSRMLTPGRNSAQARPSSPFPPLKFAYGRCIVLLKVT